MPCPMTRHDHPCAHCPLLREHFDYPARRLNMGVMMKYVNEIDLLSFINVACLVLRKSIDAKVDVRRPGFVATLLFLNI